MLKKKPDLEQIRAIISQLQSKEDLTSTEISELAVAENRLDQLLLQNPKAAEPTAPPKIIVGDPEAFKTSQIGEVIRLPVKHEKDEYLRLEQNLGCELPVCVGNRSDVKKPAIEIRTSNDVAWRLERTADSLLPAPEHYPIWLWILNKCQAAARLGCMEAPKIPINLAQLARDLGRKPDGRWYNDADEALSRFSRMVITAGQSLHMTGTGYVVSNTGAFGTLCNYVSRRTTRPSQRQLLVDGVDGWVQPGSFLWNSICSGYLKAVPLLPMRNLRSYVAQRLFLYLGKHCQPGGDYKVAISKLLPKIPINCPTKNVKIKLHPHHQALLDAGFLASYPVYEGRGTGLMVAYKRTL